MTRQNQKTMYPFKPWRWVCGAFLLIVTLFSNQAYAIEPPITAVAFAPDGTGLILGGTANARPTLVLTERCLASEVALGTCAGIVTTGGGEVATLTSGDLSVSLNSAIEGLSWTSTERFVSCAWVGAHQDRGSRVMKSDLHFHRSESSRFHSW